jgi:hypothetical protein
MLFVVSTSSDVSIFICGSSAIKPKELAFPMLRLLPLNRGG